MYQEQKFINFLKPSLTIFLNFLKSGMLEPEAEQESSNPKSAHL